MANFLDLTTSLPALWAKIKSKFYTKAEVDALIPEDEVMVVNITEDNGRYSLNKTFDEIYNHINTGGIARAVLLDSNGNKDSSSYYCVFCNTSFIVFESFSMSIENDEPHIMGKFIQIVYTQGEAEGTDVTVSSNIFINPSSNIPYMDAGTGNRGESRNYARADHVHPTDTSRAAVANVLTKTNTTSYTPTADYNPATKKYVDDTVASAAPTCATIDEIEEMCDALGFLSVTIDTSDYEERSDHV